MYKISYSSLDEVWGENVDSSSDDLNYTNQKNQTNPYHTMKEQSEKNRLQIVDNINLMEREIQNQNSMKSTDYIHYQKEPINSSVVTKNYSDLQSNYSDLQSIDKKYLLEKLMFLENQLKKYNENIPTNTQGNNSNFEPFTNQGTNQNLTQGNIYNSIFSCEIIDLIILIGIGMFIIFIMDSIFKLGKSIGTRK